MSEPQPYTDLELRIAKALYLDGFSGFLEAEAFWDAGTETMWWPYVKQARVALESLGFRKSPARVVERERLIEAIYEAELDPPVFGLTRDQAKQLADAILALISTPEAGTANNAHDHTERDQDALEIVDMLHNKINKAMSPTPPSATAIEKAREFMKRIVALDWTKNGEAEQALAALLTATSRETIERAAKIVEQPVTFENEQRYRYEKLQSKIANAIRKMEA